MVKWPPAVGKTYYSIPEEAIQYLPEAWQTQLREILSDGRAVLESVDSTVAELSRLARALPGTASLRYIHNRLQTAKFEATTEAVLEHEMLTTAFAVTYARIVNGERGRGISRKEIPPHLRASHDAIMLMRNKRYAHNDDHESYQGRLRFEYEDGSFHLNIEFALGYYINGAAEWGDLVTFIDELMLKRLNDQLRILREKTGREWSFPSGPPPDWVG